MKRDPAIDQNLANSRNALRASIGYLRLALSAMPSDERARYADIFQALAEEHSHLITLRQPPAAAPGAGLPSTPPAVISPAGLLADPPAGEAGGVTRVAPPALYQGNCVACGERVEESDPEAAVSPEWQLRCGRCAK